MEVLLLLLPQAHPIDDLGEHLEKRLAVWPQEPVSSPTSVDPRSMGWLGSTVTIIKKIVVYFILICVCRAARPFSGKWTDCLSCTASLLNACL